jgi:methylenetetrahydrofolate--tRNA-(uracil-5-)-methyltransferase
MGEQTRVFRLIPGLEKAEFVRMGAMHKNTFINSPQLLFSSLQFKSATDAISGRTVNRHGRLYGCGCRGWLAGTNAARLALGLETVTLPDHNDDGVII